MLLPLLLLLQSGSMLSVLFLLLSLLIMDIPRHLLLLQLQCNQAVLLERVGCCSLGVHLFKHQWDVADRAGSVSFLPLE